MEDIVLALRDRVTPERSVESWYPETEKDYGKS